MSEKTTALDKLTGKLENFQFKVKKHSPLLMTAAGIVGLGATAYLAYKSRDKIRGIVEQVEATREAGEEVNTLAVVTDVAIAVAPPVIVGSLSVASIFGSYHVLNNRNNILATALATATAENNRIKSYIRRKHPEILTAPVEEEEKEVLASAEEEGKKKPKTVAVVKPKEVQSLEGIWFDKSEEYLYDDHYYNQTFITERAMALSNKLMSKGFLTLNDVYGALSIPQSEANYRVGATVGWTDNDFFDLEQTVVQVEGQDGYAHPVIYISWPAVRSIYNSVDYGADLAEYRY